MTGRILLVSLAALMLLTTGVGLCWSPLLRLDQFVAAHAHRATYGHAGRTHAWLLVSTWGGPPVVRAVMLLAALGLAVSRRWLVAGWLVALVVVELLVAPATKLVLARPRPVWSHPITIVGSTSYPSGHAAAAFTAASVAVILAGRAERGVIAWAIAGSALGAAGLVAASRVLLGVHFLSDVCGGALLGVVLASATWSLGQWSRACVTGLRRPTRRTATD